MTILSPSEYQHLLSGIPKLKGRFQVETMLNTGMRYIELRRFGENRRYFDPKNRMISLPGASTKTGKSRDVHLTPQFSSRLELFLASSSLDFPTRQVMDANLKRWASVELTTKEYFSHIPEDRHYTQIMQPPTVKTFRKTWETWLLATYQDRSLDIWMSQGHTGTVSMNHYYGSVGRLKSEMDAVRECVKGWGK